MRWSNTHQHRVNIVPNNIVFVSIVRCGPIHCAPGIASHVFQNKVEGNTVRDKVVIGNCRSKVNHPGLGFIIISDRYSSSSKIFNVSAVRVAFRSINGKLRQCALKAVVDFQ